MDPCPEGCGLRRARRPRERAATRGLRRLTGVAAAARLAVPAGDIRRSSVRPGSLRLTAPAAFYCSVTTAGRVSVYRVQRTCLQGMPAIESAARVCARRTASERAQARYCFDTLWVKLPLTRFLRGP